MMCRGLGRASYNNFIQLCVIRSHAFHFSVYVQLLYLKPKVTLHFELMNISLLFLLKPN